MRKRTTAVTAPTTARPEGLDCHYVPMGQPAPIDCPRRRPQRAAIVGAVSWAWTPINDRDDTYHLSTNRPRSHWILWQSTIDRITGKPLPAVPYAFCTRAGVAPRLAAMHLLIKAWRGETNEWIAMGGDLDRFHQVAAPGLLIKRELLTAGTLAWPEPEGAG